MNRQLNYLRRGAGAAVVAVVAGGMLLTGPAAEAATSYRSVALNATVNGGTVTVSTIISASVRTSASLAGICARSSAGYHNDFPLVAATLTAAGTALTSSRSLSPGTYTYWSCAKVNGTWFDIGATRTLTVGSASATPTSTPTSPPSASTTPPGSSTVPPTPTAPPTPSGQQMPVGDLPGWKQVFTDDFSTPVAAGEFPGPYAAKWTQYDGFSDTYGYGRYSKAAISASSGMLDMFIRTENGQATVAAPAPIVTKAWQGQTYGRYTVRFKSDSLPGYKAAWLLWPDSNNWNEGEIDFPEGGLDSKIYGFNHCVGNPGSNCYYFDTKTTFTGWHTATLEWSPGKLTYILDELSGSTTSSVPTTPMHWVLQTETGGGAAPAAAVAGHMLIDWVSVYTYRP